MIETTKQASTLHGLSEHVYSKSKMEYRGRNIILSATRPSSIRNFETMAYDYMPAFRRENTTALPTIFNTCNLYCCTV